MRDDRHIVRVEGLEWTQVLPFLHLFKSFRAAVHPLRLTLALLAVVLIYLGGCLLDFVFGPVAHPTEIQQHDQLSEREFEAWKADRETSTRSHLRQLLGPVVDSGEQLKTLLDTQDRFDRGRAAVHDHARDRREKLLELDPQAVDPERLEQRLERLARERRERLDALDALEPTGVFQAALRFKLDAFERLVTAVTNLNLGIEVFRSEGPPEADTVLGALRDLAVVLPAWLIDTHPGFLSLYLIGVTAVLCLIGLAICRHVVSEIATGESVTLGQAIRFARGKFVWALLCPIIPVLILLGVWLLLALMGLVFFNLPVLDVVGALLFILALAIALIAAMLLIGLVLGAGLMLPALAVEGTDAFDAVSRAYNYVFGRFWRWLAYNAVGLAFGAVAYLILAALLYFALAVAHHGVSAGVFVQAAAAAGPERFHAMMPEPQLGRFDHQTDPSLGLSGRVASHVLRVWVFLFLALLGAFAVSFFFSVQSWIYFLLRRVADGTEFDDIYLPDRGPSRENLAEVGAEADPDHEAV